MWLFRITGNETPHLLNLIVLDGGSPNVYPNIKYVIVYQTAGREVALI